MLPATRPGKKTLLGAILSGSLLLATVPGIALAAGPVTHYAFSPSPIHATATLAANATVAVTVSAEDSTNALVPGAVVFLSFSQTTGGGSAMVGTVALTATPVAYTATTGKITITYRAPAILPMGGKDIVKAGNTKTTPTIGATDIYSFAKVSRYVFSPSPIAVPGTLAAGGTVAVTLTAFNAAAVAVPNATVYLSFAPAVGGGSASVGLIALTATPTAFKAGVTGQVAITYKAPALLPASGTDSIVVQDAAKNPTIARTDSYSFAGLHSFLFGPSPIAATGTLHGSARVAVTLTAKDLAGNPIAGANVYLSFMPASGGGTASVGAKVLSATPARFTTGSAGTIVITYATPATTPTTGTDTLTAGNLKALPTVTASDTYTW
jgi:hypothetical protein